MASIENTSTRKPVNKKRINKKATRVDLTPMVDLGFLLITFFVFTTQLALPTAMNLNMPDDKVAPADDVCASCALTVILQADNIIRYYEGMAESNTAIKQTSFGAVRDVILKKKKEVERINGTANDFVLIIKPDDKSRFQNFVDIVDEVTINKVKHYYIDEINAADEKLLALK